MDARKNAMTPKVGKLLATTQQLKQDEH